MENLKVIPEIYCSNLEITKNFYLDVLGFKIKYERLSEKFVYFTLNNLSIMVQCLSSRERKWITGKMNKPFGRGISFQWEVIDVEKLYFKIKNKSPKNIFMEIETKSYQCDDKVVEQKQFIVKDPDRYLFRFCES